MSERLTAALAQIARDAGAGFGVADVRPFDEDEARLVAARRSGRSGPLRFTYDDPGLATDVARSFPWARRLVVLGWSYLTGPSARSETGAWVGRFATTDHYRGLRAVGEPVAALLREEGYRAELLSDDNRLVDRAAAVRAGVGWRGRSTMVLSPGHGPWTLLGSVVTDAPLEVGREMRRDCGSCVACIPACPTGAISGEGLDARRCLSTWLQTPASIPHWIRPRLGRRIYGCDECLVACPPGGPARARSSKETLALPFPDLLALSDEELLERFSWWYVPRRQGRFIRRNLLIAAGNSGQPELRTVVEAHLRHPSSMIRGHAAWAMARAFGLSAAEGLRLALAEERAPEARDELALALVMAEQPEGYRKLIAADEAAHMDTGIRGLALLGPLAAGERAGGLDLVFLRGRGEERRLALPMARIYDPDRLLETARRELTDVERRSLLLLAGR